MSKKNKRGVLNQVVEEPIEETKEVVVESEPIIVDPELLKIEQPEEVVEEEPIELQDETLPELPIEEPEKTELDRIAEALAEAKAEEVPVEEPVEEPKEFHHEFQKDYFFGTPTETADKETVIDALPIEEPKPRTIASLSRDELRNFQRTGKMPK